MKMNRKSRDYRDGFFEGRNLGVKDHLKKAKQYESEMKRHVRSIRNYKYATQDEYDYSCGLRDGLTSQVEQKEKRMKRR